MSETFEEELKKHAKMGTEIENLLDTDLEEEWKEVAEIQWVRVEDAVAVHRLHLAELLKNRPRAKRRHVPEMGYEWDFPEPEEYEHFLRELEGLLKK